MHMDAKHLQKDIKTVRTNQETNAAKAQLDFWESPLSDLMMVQNFSKGC